MEKKLKITEIEKIAKNILEVQGHHSPQIMFYKNNQLNMGILKFSNHEEKNSIIQTIRKLIKEQKIDSYCLIIEAWMSIKDIKDKQPYIRPTYDPNKKECLIVSIYNKDLTFEIVNNIFKREDKKIIWLDRKYETNNEFSEYKSIWNFYLENIPEDEFMKYISSK